MNSKLSAQQLIQEKQYCYPYHYIPTFSDGKFSQATLWSWGMHYFAGIQLVLSRLDSLSFDSLIDVGCGG